MPSHQIDLQAYQRFLFACFRDARFTSDGMWAAMRQESPELSWFDGVLYRLIVIPRTRRIAGELEKEASWTGSRPATGPGRVDTFNPYKVVFGLDVKRELRVGTADLPSLWNQGMREGMWLHWDGNNDLVTERNKSAAIGAGCSEESLDLSSMKRVEEWNRTLPAPAFPLPRKGRLGDGQGGAVGADRDRPGASEFVYG